ncbi:ligand-binding sensor domain-containing diguanylate cyclase [Coralloluteibacterium stylophorae]|uniref:diguanylate cyclase n=1 Tax=Coralloluteibacterium stylophorae TaxID=1776034 RepID=A0A8J7VRE3_9GAMM|nr:ligand-binding sensor domain-containing diguanylate cyclase [Coralloluteibacterium stylophorae]MBS7457964.1 diguanylate cyclase [Coralloluteibacterium stylophorae]
MFRTSSILPGLLLGALLLLAAWAPSARAADAWAPFESLWFEHVTVRDGLPHSTVTSIVQDRHGLVWMGTFGGLVRYDGHRMQVYSEDPDETRGLPDVYARTLLPLADGSLLVGTNAGGLVRHDPRDGRFLRYPVGGPGGTADAKIFALAAARDGGVWIATEAGVDRLDPASGRIAAVPGPGEVPGMARRTFTVLEDRDGALWVGGDTGLFVRRAGSDRFVAAADGQPAAAAAALREQVWALHQDRAGRLWVGTGRHGVLRIATDGRAVLPPGLGGDGPISRRTVRSILELDDGEVWIATDGAGLVTVQPDGRVRAVRHDPALQSSLPGDITRAVFQDRSGLVWIATEVGAARHDPGARGVFSMLASPLQDTTLSDPNVHTIFVDPRGRIWLGEGMGRIDVLDLAAGRLHRIALTGGQAGRDVQAFVIGPDGAVWAGAQGIARIDPETFAVTPGLLPDLEGRLILSMQRDGERVLIGSYDGVHRYDMRSGRLEQFLGDPDDPRTLAGNQVRAITRLDGRWWFSTTTGASIADLDRGEFVTLRHDPDDPATLPQNYTGAPVEDGRGRVWMPTFGGIGVGIRTPGRGDGWRFDRIGGDEGLSNLKVNALLLDDAGDAWASLANGLARIDGATLQAQDLGARDGLRVASYVHRAAARAPDGSLLFGGLGGLTVVRPGTHPGERERLDVPLAITGLRFDDAALPADALPAAGGALAVPAGARSLHVDFALLDYRTPAEIRYAYRLVGFDDAGWTQVPRGAPPTATYTNLPSGTYTLELRATVRGLHGGAVVEGVEVEVAPHWHETLPARLAMAVLVAASLFGIFHLATLVQRRRARRLERLVRHRTRDLQAANARLDTLASTDELSGLLNRRRFLQLAEAERRRAMREGAGFALLLIDLDHFKAINDTWGHPAGDAVIAAAGARVAAACRADDHVARYGGEELIVCLPGAGAATALAVAEDVRRTIAASPVDYSESGTAIRITTSVGVAVWHAPDEALAALLQRADRALYAAKRAGRDCVVAAD